MINLNQTFIIQLASRIFGEEAVMQNKSPSSVYIYFLNDFMFSARPLVYHVMR